MLNLRSNTAMMSSLNSSKSFEFWCLIHVNSCCSLMLIHEIFAGLYLWEHILNGKLENKGVWSYGFKRVDNLKFKWVLIQCFEIWQFIIKFILSLYLIFIVVYFMRIWYISREFQYITEAKFKIFHILIYYYSQDNFSFKLVFLLDVFQRAR